MVYNADGQRVQLDDSSGKRKFVHDARNVLLETDGAGATQSLYTLEPSLFGNLLSQRQGANSHFHLFDALGSTVNLVDNAQAITDSYVYKAYGGLHSSSGSTVNPYRFVGRQGYEFLIDLLQYHVRARDYGPDLARWLSQDPIGIINGFNLFSYVNNNPGNLVDPSGEIPLILEIALQLIPIANIVTSALVEQKGDEIEDFIKCKPQKKKLGDLEQKLACINCIRSLEIKFQASNVECLPIAAPLQLLTSLTVGLLVSPTVGLFFFVSYAVGDITTLIRLSLDASSEALEDYCG